LELGQSDPALAGSIDEIITWYASIDKSNDSLAMSLLERYGDQQFRLRFEEFLDQQVVSNATGAQIFPRSLSSNQAKTRYRYLIRIFHPDRGFKSQAWLNSRAEKINNAFKSFRTDELVRPVVAPKPQAVDRSAIVEKPPKRARNFKIKYRSETWRKRFGSPRSLQRKIIVGLISLCALLILFFYASTQDLAQEQTGNPSPQQTQATPKDTVAEPPSKTESRDSLTSEEPLSEEHQKIILDAQWLNSNSADLNPIELDVNEISPDTPKIDKVATPIDTVARPTDEATTPIDAQEN
jgi:hypothetical protein